MDGADLDRGNGHACPSLADAAGMWLDAGSTPGCSPAAIVTWRARTRIQNSRSAARQAQPPPTATGRRSSPPAAPFSALQFRTHHALQAETVAFASARIS